jgi:YVTN family beta-propeller protein
MSARQGDLRRAPLLFLLLALVAGSAGAHPSITQSNFNDEVFRLQTELRIPWAAITPNGIRAYVPDSTTIWCLIDTGTNTVTAALTVGDNPLG